jgi:tetratricopeptide (TPR) repeat protein
LNPRLLYPLLDTATDLDPHFIAAYNYGAILLPAIDREKAILIAQKGIRENPDAWRLYQYLGYIYWKLGRYNEAADTFEKGSRIPEAAPFMKLMAASMQTQGGSRSTARAVYRQMLSDSDDPMVKLTAERRLAGLDSLDERDAIDKALAESKDQTGKCPGSLADIMPRLMGVRLPEGNEFKIDNANRLVDPTGAPYLLDQQNCKTLLDTENTQVPLK